MTSKKNRKDKIILVLTGLLCMGISSCNTGGKNISGNRIYKPGVYTGSAFGAKGDITVAVEVTKDSILNIWSLKNDDSPFIGELAVETVGKNIIESQSLSVDGLTGATLSSFGVIAAVENALSKSGIDTAALFAHTGRQALREGPAEEYDVVVVGGGPAGLTAALSVHTDINFSNVRSGLKVLVIERLGFAGGAQRFSAGMISSFSGTVLNEASGVTVDSKLVADTWKESAKDKKSFIDQIALRSVELGAPVLNGLIKRGYYISMEDGIITTLNSPLAQGGVINYPATRVASRTTGLRSFNEGSIADGYYLNGGSPWLAESLIQLVKDAGIEIRVNTSAESLIIENGVCTGVTVSGNGKRYQIKAKKTILATGYSDTRNDTCELFYPDAKGTVWFGCPGNTADAPKWIHAMGGEVSIGKPKMTLGYNSVLGYFGEESFLYSRYNTIWVDSGGNRFFDEGSARTAARLLALDEPYAYMVFDANNAGVTFVDTLSKHHIAWQADSIAELADKLGIAGDALNATIRRYNADYKNGGDTVFGTALDRMAPVEKAPFYAVKVSPVSSGEYATVIVDDNCRVLLREGRPVANLYACGGAMGNTFNKDGRGAGNMTALTTGALTGEMVRLALLRGQ